VEKFIFDGGVFSHSSLADKAKCVETKSDKSGTVHFAGTGRNLTWIRVYYFRRKLTLRLPVGGGMRQCSNNDGNIWNRLYQMKKTN
jgi:hypothetical protein